MKKLTVTCDRCGKVVEEQITELTFTGGYYDCSGEPWSKFANEGEKDVCDDCMWRDPRYVAVYGDNFNNSK